MRADPLLKLLLIALLLGALPALLPAGWLPGERGDGLATAWAEDEDDDPPGDEEDPFSDPDTYDSPTSFTPQQAERAILRGVTYLKKVQQDDGSWGPLDTTGGRNYGGGQGPGYTHPAGPTALALYALLKCKVPVRDPTIRKGFAWLKDNYEVPDGTYECAMLLLALCATANPYKTRSGSRDVERFKLSGRYRGWAQKVHAEILEKQTGGAWRYQVKGNPPEPTGSQDLSSTQLVTLSLFAAHVVRIRTRDRIWEDILEFSLAQQDDTGPEVPAKDPLTGETTTRHARGFAYQKGHENPEEGQSVGSMTACGMANVMMSRFVLSDGGRKQEQWDERPDAQRIQRSIEDALAWLQVNWSNWDNPGKRQSNVYTVYWLYSVERAMDLTGLHKIGNHLWYSEMGQQLIDRQREDGSWDSNSGFPPRDVLDTSFALLFLKKATSGQIPFPSLTGGTDEAPVDNR